MDTSNKILKYLETVEKDVKFIEEQIKANPNNITQYEEPVSLKDYEAYLQANMSPEKFQEYKSTRVTIPVSQSAHWSPVSQRSFHQ